jgi:DNA polymerase elongation subunit (family B)
MDFTRETKKCIIDTESTNFLPWIGKLILIGIMDINTKKIKIFQDNDEKTMLIQFLLYFNEKRYNEILGYNLPHDSRFLLAKCIQYQIPANILFGATHTDIMMILKGMTHHQNFNRPGRKSEWVKFLLEDEKPHQSVRELYLQNRIPEIIDHCKTDLEQTYEIWNRIKFVLTRNV